MQTLTEANVRELLVDGSMQQAVFVYFYANAPECAQTTQAIGGAISDNNAYISLVYADISTPVGQGLCLQLGFEGVPALAVFVKGRPVEALQGNDVLTRLSEIISKYMPDASALAMKEALEAEAQGDLNTALTKASEAYQAGDNKLEYKHILARLYLKVKNLAKVHELLDNPGREEQSMQEYKDLISALTLSEQALDSPEIKELEQQHQAHPQDRAITLKLAVAYSSAGRKQPALDLLYELLKQDLTATEVKQTFLDIISTMAGDPLQKQYRNKLYTLLY